MAARNDIPISFLRECFDYDPETGIVRWRERPLSHFSDEGLWSSWNIRFSGKQAGSPIKTGYLLASITPRDEKRFGVYVHHIAWALTTGEWPKNEIDHRDHDRANNRFNNLRQATHAQNHQNRKTVRGTTYEPRTGKWCARIHVDDRNIHLGTFGTEAEAREAYLKAKTKHHPFG